VLDGDRLVGVLVVEHLVHDRARNKESVGFRVAAASVVLDEIREERSVCNDASRQPRDPESPPGVFDGEDKRRCVRMAATSTNCPDTRPAPCSMAVSNTSR
jgi:hypothetical protein